jgi:hypothetical protein
MAQLLQLQRRVGRHRHPVLAFENLSRCPDLHVFSPVCRCQCSIRLLNLAPSITAQEYFKAPVATFPTVAENSIGCLKASAARGRTIIIERRAKACAQARLLLPDEPVADQQP